MRIFRPEEWSDLITRLQSLKQPRYVQFYGNAGDALIASGAARLFGMAGVKPTPSSMSDIRPGDNIVIAGGGNLVPEYRDCANILRRCLEVDVERVLLLPHTIRGHDELLARLDSRFAIACRDYPTMQWVQEHAPRASVFFTHDLALLLDPATFTPRRRPMADLARRCRNRRYLKWRVRLLGVHAQRGKLAIFRGDSERTSQPQRQDVSGYYGSRYVSPAECDDITADVFRIMRKADELHTNRLHMGIAGALSGLKVFLYDNSYGKISAMHEASLARFPNVSFSSGGLR